MNTGKFPQNVDEPTFDGEEYLETMEIQATLRAWHRKHAAPPHISRGSVEALPASSERPSDSPGQPRRHLWLFWKRRPA